MISNKFLIDDVVVIGTYSIGSGSDRGIAFLSASSLTQFGSVTNISHAVGTLE